MKSYIIVFLLGALTLFSCKKIEGKGGRSSIIGKVHMTDKTGNNQGNYDAPNMRVYLIYGDESTTHNDDMRTSFDGTFAFENLREGNYRVYTYSEVTSEPSGLLPVFKDVSLGKEEVFDVGTIEVVK